MPLFIDAFPSLEISSISNSNSNSNEPVPRDLSVLPKPRPLSSAPSLTLTTIPHPVARTSTGKRKAQYQGLKQNTMAKGGGIALKGLSTILYFLKFCCAAIILGIFSYFLATLHSNQLHIPLYERAVEGISGAAVVWTFIAMLFVCCLGGVAVISILAMLLNLAFCGAFIYIAYATRSGAHSCSGTVNTPLGSGAAGRVSAPHDGIVHIVKYHTACKLNKAVFAVAIAGAVLFLLSVLAEILLMRHHRKEKAYGPSPNNGYTAGSPRRKFYQRKPKATTATHSEKPDTLPTHSTPHDVRNSYNTESTAVGAGAQDPTFSKYGNTGVPATHGGAAQEHGVLGQEHGAHQHGVHQPAQPSVYGAPNYGQGAPEL